jgi:thioredoxin reductase
LSVYQYCPRAVEISQEYFDGADSEESMHDLIIVGGGAAALSSATYALGKQLNVLIIYEQLGGKTNFHFTVRSEEDFLVGHILVHLAFPEEKPVGESQFAGEETVHLFERQIKARSGVALRDRVVGVSKIGDVFHVETEHHGFQHGRALIVATGVAPRALDVPGAREFLGQGLGYSPTTYARLLDNKRAAVIGTSTRALRGAAELSRSAAHVYLVEPEPIKTTNPLLDVLRQRPNVEIFEGYKVLEVIGNSTVEHVVIERNGERRDLNVDAAFVDMGLQPNTGVVSHFVETDPDGFIVVDSRNATSLPGLFAAGDVTTAFGEQVLIAVGDGARAGLSAYEYLLTKLLEESTE